MNEYYFNFIKEKMKKDIISKLTQNDNIKNIENIDEIVEKEVNEYFSKNEIILEEENNDNIVQSKTHVYRDRTQYKHRENMCKARVWNCGMTGSISMTMLCRCIILKYPILPLLKSKKCINTMLETFILHRQSCAYFLY